MSGRLSAAGVDRPAVRDEPGYGAGEHADGETSDDIDGPVGADLDPVARHQDGSGDTNDALPPPHPSPQCAHCGDQQGRVRRGVGVAVWLNRVAVRVEAVDHRQRSRLPGEQLPDLGHQFRQGQATTSAAGFPDTRWPGLR
jgi:hypothetical protein